MIITNIFMLHSYQRIWDHGYPNSDISYDQSHVDRNSVEPLAWKETVKFDVISLEFSLFILKI